ncbi:hypothetical protein AR456_17180 [Halomonas huangheensis]|nr:hypothetical protein AR456_17180 [Halomonas huangheensis]
MTDQSHFRPGAEYRDNAAWRIASLWQQKARQARPAGQLSGIKLVLAWVIGCTMLIVATLLGLTFSLIGLLMLPLVRRRMKKRMEQARAQHAEDIGPVHQKYSQTQSDDILEGQYEIKR